MRELEFYFPKTKSKHMAIPTQGKKYPSKGGTVRYGVQASMNGSMSLPKYVKEEEFHSFRFGKVHSSGNIYPQEFLDTFYDFDSHPTADTYEDDETVELAYQAWYQNYQKGDYKNEVLNAEVSVGEKRQDFRKDYDIENELSGFENMEVGDINLEDYQDEITESLEDEFIEAIRESVDDNVPLSDEAMDGGYINVDTELEITVPISGDINYDWTAKEGYTEDNSSWDAETGLEAITDPEVFGGENITFHGENYKNHLKMVKRTEAFVIAGEKNDGQESQYAYIKDIEDKEGFTPELLLDVSSPTIQNTMKSAIKKGAFDNHADTVGNPSPSSPLEEVPATVPSPAEPTNETFGAFSIDEDDEGKIHIENKCDGCGKEFLFTQNSNIVGGNRAGAIVYENLDWKDEYGETGHDYPEYSPYGDLLCKSCWKINREEDENADSRGQGQYGAEMDELSEDTSIIRNRVGDMVGMVELDENDEDIEKVDIDIIDDDGEMAYEGTLGAEIEYDGAKRYARSLDSRFDGANDEGYFPVDEDDFSEMVVDEIGEHTTLDAETFESQGTNTKMILGITALAIGLGLWKGKEIMSLSDKVTEAIKKMKK